MGDKNIGIPIATDYFSQIKCRWILCPALEGGLPASGIFQNMHQDIVHSPLCFQVLGILLLYVSQGIKHFEALTNATPIEGITRFMCSMGTSYDRIIKG